MTECLENIEIEHGHKEQKSQFLIENHNKATLALPRASSYGYESKA